MIALTKEKREELIACANEIKKMPTSTHGYKVDNDAFGSNALMLMDVALASLTAEEVNQVIFNNHLDDGYVEWADCNKDYFNRNPSDYRRVLYTAPPVPEINPSSELTALLNAIDSFQVVKASARWNESGKWDDAYEELSEAAIKAAPLIKRLNGLGE